MTGRRESDLNTSVSTIFKKAFYLFLPPFYFLSSSPVSITLPAHLKYIRAKYIPHVRWIGVFVCTRVGSELASGIRDDSGTEIYSIEEQKTFVPPTKLIPFSSAVKVGARVSRFGKESLRFDPRYEFIFYDESTNSVVAYIKFSDNFITLSYHWYKKIM